MKVTRRWFGYGIAERKRIAAFIKAARRDHRYCCLAKYTKGSPMRNAITRDLAREAMEGNTSRMVAR